MKELANQFLNAKSASRDAGELTARSWQDCNDACDLIVSHFGKGRLVADIGPDDFAELRKKMAKRWGPGTLGNVINRMRVAFKFASDNRLIDRPVCCGSAFKRPSRKTLRIDKAKKRRKLFTAGKVRALADGALVVGSDGPELVQPGVQLRARILLGINWLRERSYPIPDELRDTPVCRLAVAGTTLRLDGKTVPLGATADKQDDMLRYIAAEGERRSDSEAVEGDGRLDGVHLDRLRKSLPDSIRALIDTNKNRPGSKVVEGG